jgi:hypothetical protein
MAVASLVLAVVAIIIALASVRYTRRQAVASESVTAIEAKRLHDDLTPELVITCTAPPGADIRRADMTLELTGPPGLGDLDEVTVEIRDDMPERKPGPGSQMTQEQISEVIWGPYRLNPAVKDTDSLGRKHGPFRLPIHEPYPIPLEQSMAPPWTNPEHWRNQYKDKPVRLEITCRRQGHEPWILRPEAEVTPETPGYVW